MAITKRILAIVLALTLAIGGAQTAYAAYPTIVSVGPQVGALIHGTPGAATFVVTTANIPVGADIVANGGHDDDGYWLGIGMGTTNTTGSVTTIIIRTTAETPPGSHPLFLTIGDQTTPEVIQTSETFYLTVGRVHPPQPPIQSQPPEIQLSSSQPHITMEIAQAEVLRAFAAARAVHTNHAVLNFRNPGSISTEVLRYISDSGMAEGFTKALQADSLNAQSNAVNVRITLDPAQFTRGMNLYASTTNARATQTAGMFRQFFTNDLMAVSLGQQGNFGQDVLVAARLSPDMDTANLVFYTYDREANRFTLIANPNARVDSNGFVHFNTGVGGDIVISNGALARR